MIRECVRGRANLHWVYVMDMGRQGQGYKEAWVDRDKGTGDGRWHVQG